MRAARWDVERLEPRTLLAFAPLGPEFHAVGFNTRVPAVAADADGDFVIVSANGAAVFGQGYNAAGAPQGGVFSVGASNGPASVAMDAEGDFVVARRAVAGSSIFVRVTRYDAAGVSQGEVVVNNGYGGTSPFSSPSVAIDENGDFVVAWENLYGAGLYGDRHYYRQAYAQRYNATGAPKGDAFRIDSSPAAEWDLNPTVAADSHGNFVAAWQNRDQDGSGFGVYARRYDSAGVAQGGEFRVNTTTDGDQAAPAVSVDYAGDFVVTWQGNGPGDADGVFAQRYNAAGTPQGGEFRVNTTTSGAQGAPSLAADADGDFVVTWSGNGPADADGVFAQRYNAAGVPQGGEIIVNTSTAGAQQNPSVATDADGDLVVVWETPGSVVAQRYEQTIDTAGPTVTDVWIGGRSVLTAPVDSPIRQITVNFSERVSTLGGAAGSDSVTNPANWHLVQDSNDITSSIRSIAFSFNAVTHKYQAVLDLSSPLLGGNYVLYALPTIRDPSANALDGDANGSPGGVFGVGFQNLFVNQPPTTIGIPAVSVAEDQEDVLINLFDAFSDDVDPDPALAYEVAFNGNPALFEATRVDLAAGALVLALAPNANGEAQLSVRATDTAGAWVETTFTVTVLPVNDPPVNTVPAVQVLRPGQVVTFGSDRGNPIIVSDVDDPNATVSVLIGKPANLTLTVKNKDGVDVRNEREALRITGPIPFVNAALDGLQATQLESRAEEDALFITTDDLGSRGIGGPMVDTDSIPIVFAEAPVLLTVGDVTVAEGNAGTTAATFVVRLSGKRSGPVGVHFATADGTATVAGDDYQPTQGDLVFGTADTEQKVTVLVNGDFDVEGNEQFFLNLSDAGGGAVISDAQGVATITNDDVPLPPPVVTQVFVGGSGWTAAYRNYLQAQGLGDATFGFAVPAGAAQLNVLPWGNLNQISVRFNTDVLVVDQDLAVRGTRSAAYGVASIDYDDSTHTTTWTLAQPVVNDKLLLDLNGGVDGIVNPQAVALDGDWASGSDAYPSGDGTPGGSLRFRLNVLGGDVTRDGKVTYFDWLELRRRITRTATNPGPPGGATSYGAFFDCSGDGAISTPDLLTVRRNLLRALPVAEPAAPAALAAPSITRDVLGTGAQTT